MSIRRVIAALMCLLLGGCPKSQTSLLGDDTAALRAGTYCVYDAKSPDACNWITVFEPGPADGDARGEPWGPGHVYWVQDQSSLSYVRASRAYIPSGALAGARILEICSQQGGTCMFFAIEERSVRAVPVYEVRGAACSGQCDFSDDAALMRWFAAVSSDSEYATPRGSGSFAIPENLTVGGFPPTDPLVFDTRPAPAGEVGSWGQRGDFGPGLWLAGVVVVALLAAFILGARSAAIGATVSARTTPPAAGAAPFREASEGAPAAAASTRLRFFDRLPRQLRLILAVAISPFPGSLVGGFLMTAYLMIFDPTDEAESFGDLFTGTVAFAVFVFIFALVATATLGLLWHAYAARSGRVRAIDYTLAGALAGAVLEIVLTALMPPLGGFDMAVAAYTICGSGAGATIGIVAWLILRPDLTRTLTSVA